MKYEKELTTLFNQDKDLKRFLKAVLKNRDNVRITSWVSDDEHKLFVQIEGSVEQIADM